MKLNPLFICIATLSALFCAGNSFGQDAPKPKVQFPAPSPACTIKQRVGLTDIEVAYSRPGCKGRKIYGSLVPYGQVWRTGANAATKITFSTPMKVEGREIPAGSYALFTIPGQDEWTIILSTNANQFGAFQYDEKSDALRVKVAPVQLAEHIETLTIEFNHIRDESAILDIIWDNVAVPVHLQHDLTATLVPQIEAAMSAEGGQKPYYQAAMFYFDHGQDLNKAKEWINAALKQRDAHYMEYLKAEILAKLGDKEGAIAAAKRSTELAKKANDTGYIQLNEDLISSLQ